MRLEKKEWRKEWDKGPQLVRITRPSYFRNQGFRKWRGKIEKEVETIVPDHLQVGLLAR